MAMTLRPRLDILPAAQRRLWDELSAVPQHFVLYFGDGDLASLPEEVREGLARAATVVDPRRLPAIDQTAEHGAGHQAPQKAAHGAAPKVGRGG